MEDFTTLAYLLSYPGMIAAVVMLTQFMKKMFSSITGDRVKVVVYAWSAIFCVIAGAFQGKFTTGAEILETCLIWTVNSVIIWFAAMKAYETIADDTDGVLEIDTSSPEKDVWRLNLGDKLSNIETKSEIKLKVDTDANLSQ